MHRAREGDHRERGNGGDQSDDRTRGEQQLVGLGWDEVFLEDQLDRVGQRVKQAGLTDQITILLKDYRSVTGLYDKIISVEMIEAVGRQFLERFFRQCNSLLKPNGTMVLQAITIPDDRYEKYCKERDWIQKHIFPGGHLPCLSVLRKAKLL